MRLPARLAVLRERNYRLLFAGQVTSVLGDEMTPVALSFAVLDRGGNARQVGLVLGSGAFTLVLFLLAGGVIADRLPRRAVMVGADAVRGAVQAASAVLLLTGAWRLWELAVLQAAWGVGAAFFTPALTGLVPEVVTAERLPEANALQGLTWSIGAVAGPALAGVLLATTGAGAALLVDAATFAVSAVTLSRLRLTPSVGSKGRTMVADLREGWVAFRERTWLWVIVVQFALWHMVAFAPVIVLGAVVAKAHFGGAAAWGSILAAFGAGSIAGGVVALHLRPRRPLLVATASTLLFVPLPALLALAAPVTATAVAAAGGGAGFAVFGTLWDTTLQQQVPQQLLSRVSSYDWFGSVALLPVGYALAGPVAGLIGLATTLWVAAGWTLVTTVAVLLVPAVTGLQGELQTRLDAADDVAHAP